MRESVPVASSTDNPSLRSTRRRSSFARIIPILLLAAYIAQCAWFIRTQSLTYDEPVDIAGGLDAWRNHRFELWNDHTPLARLICTLSLIDHKWEIDVDPSATVGWRVPRIVPDPETLAWRARSMDVLLGVALGILLWLTARRMFSEGTANLSLALFVFSPSAIALFSVATTDGIAALMIFAAATTLAWWKEQPSFRRTGVLGSVLGLMLLAKFSTPVMFIIAMGWILVGHIHPRKWNWTRAATALVIAVAVLWAGYFFHVSRVTLRNQRLVTSFPHRADVIYQPIHSGLNLTLFVPAGEYFEGLRAVVRHNRHGMPGFLLGQVKSAGGWKSYYPVVIALKWPVIIVLLFATSVVFMVRRRIRAPLHWPLFASFPLVYFAFAVFSKFDLGERHIFPIYVFVVLFAGAVWEALQLVRYGALLAVALVLLQTADTMRYAPGYLSYFNIWIPPAATYRFLADSNVDWGQGLLAVREYERTHPKNKISLAYFGSVEPQVYGIRALPLREKERTTGTVIVGATNLSGEYLSDPAAYHWLLQYPRTAILDHSLFVFAVPQSGDNKAVVQRQ